MTRKLLLPIFGVAIATLAACSSKKAASGTAAVPALTQADADRAASKFPGATMASLTDGKNHYENNCGKCHKLHAPADFSEEKWRKVVPPMSGKANVDKNTENLILQYVVAMSAK